MKLSPSVPIIGIISPWLSPVASTRYTGIHHQRSPIAAVNSFPPLPPIAPSVNSHPTSLSRSQRHNRRRRRCHDPSETFFAGFSHLRAGDVDDDNTALKTSSISDVTGELISRGGGTSVAIAHESEEEEEMVPRVDHPPRQSPLKPSMTTLPELPRSMIGADVSDDDEASHKEYAKKLKNRNHTNLARKITHAGFGIFFACLNQFLPHSKFVPGMAILTSATLLMELLRYRKWFGWMNDALHFVLGGSLRKHEMEGKFTGSFYYFAGVTATSYLFPRTAATMGICQLALADPSASYFGRRTRHIYWSRIENGLGGIGRNKGVLGFLGGALFCFPFNYRVFKIAKWGAKGVPGGETAMVAASLLLGLAGAFADLAVPTPALTMPKKVLGVPVPPFHVDDNFVVPIFSGFACTKIFDLMGWDQGLELAKHIIF